MTQVQQLTQSAHKIQVILICDGARNIIPEKALKLKVISAPENKVRLLEVGT